MIITADIVTAIALKPYIYLSKFQFNKMKKMQCIIHYELELCGL